jgi:DNA modification methylase
LFESVDEFDGGEEPDALAVMLDGLDADRRGEIVIDPFLGSGSTLIAADNTGRVCRGVEFDPLYVDVIVRRYEAATGNSAVLVETSETLDALAARKSRETAPV